MIGDTYERRASTLALQSAEGKLKPEWMMVLFRRHGKLEEVFLERAGNRERESSHFIQLSPHFSEWNMEAPLIAPRPRTYDRGPHGDRIPFASDATTVDATVQGGIFRMFYTSLSLRTTLGA